MWLVRTDASMWFAVVVVLCGFVLAGCVAWPFKQSKEADDAADFEA